MKPICFIGARGGSKGIPFKNTQDLGGKPLIHWTIEPAVEFSNGEKETTRRNKGRKRTKK